MEERHHTQKQRKLTAAIHVKDIAFDASSSRRLHDPCHHLEFVGSTGIFRPCRGRHGSFVYLLLKERLPIHYIDELRGIRLREEAGTCSGCVIDGFDHIIHTVDGWVRVEGRDAFFTNDVRRWPPFAHDSFQHYLLTINRE